MVSLPLSTVITSANTHEYSYDVTVAIDTVDSIVIKRQSSSSSSSSTDRNKKKKHNLCLDKAYHSKEVEREIIKRGYNNPHIRHRREEKLFRKKHPTRRWVVERENKFLHNRFRKLFTR